MPNPQAGGPPHVGSPRLLIQYICSYPPYLEQLRGLGYGTVEGSREHGNEPVGSIKCCEVRE
jgi:hypothetical protein